ncbi:MAG: hypothetical protein HZY73_12605 [Micropruina sp.]|nr:MAG: hypothetical protein HZY73_12605 [Micropruina sp.]
MTWTRVAVREHLMVTFCRASPAALAIWAAAASQSATPARSAAPAIAPA